MSTIIKDDVIASLRAENRQLRRQIEERTQRLGDVSESIISEVCDAFEITREQLLTRSKEGHLCAARREIAYRLTIHRWSSCRIGKLLNRNSKTIRYMLARHADLQSHFKAAAE